MGNVLAAVDKQGTIGTEEVTGGSVDLERRADSLRRAGAVKKPVAISDCIDDEDAIKLSLRL
jgi:hypothetical protein